MCLVEYYLVEYYLVEYYLVEYHLANNRDVWGMFQ